VSPSRSQLVAAALAVLTGLVAPALAACSSAPGATCPGAAVAAVQLTFIRTAQGCANGTAPKKSDGVTDDWDALYKPLIGYAEAAPPDRTPVSVTFGYGPGAGAAALCTGKPWATPLTGTVAVAVAGDTIDVAARTDGAVLAACAATCTVTAEQQVTGLLARDPTGAITGFAGTLVETDTPRPDATCGPCTGPCTATWQLASASVKVP
jgi:hypothetical protein